MSNWQPFPSRDDGSIAWRVFHEMHDWLEKRGVKIDLGDDLEMRGGRWSFEWRNASVVLRPQIGVNPDITYVAISESTR